MHIHGLILGWQCNNPCTHTHSEWIRASQRQHLQLTHEGHAHMHVVHIAGCVTVHTANLAYWHSDGTSLTLPFVNCTSLTLLFVNCSRCRCQCPPVWERGHMHKAYLQHIQCVPCQLYSSSHHQSDTDYHQIVLHLLPCLNITSCCFTGVIGIEIHVFLRLSGSGAGAWLGPSNTLLIRNAVQQMSTVQLYCNHLQVPGRECRWDIIYHKRQYNWKLRVGL